MTVQDIAVVGAGSYGSCLAMLFGRAGHRVTLWARNPEIAAQMEQSREAQAYLPGHKLPYRGLPERLEQLAENHESALARLAASLADQPRTAADCFDMLFRRRIGEGEYGLALAEAVAHVNAMAARGMIHRIGETPEGGAIWGAPAAPAGRDSGVHFG